MSADSQCGALSQQSWSTSGSGQNLGMLGGAYGDPSTMGGQTLDTLSMSGTGTQPSNYGMQPQSWPLPPGQGAAAAADGQHYMPFGFNKPGGKQLGQNRGDAGSHAGGSDGYDPGTPHGVNTPKSDGKRLPHSEAEDLFFDGVPSQRGPPMRSNSSKYRRDTEGRRTPSNQSAMSTAWSLVENPGASSQLPAHVHGTLPNAPAADEDNMPIQALTRGLSQVQRSPPSSPGGPSAAVPGSSGRAGKKEVFHDGRTR